VEPTVAQRVGTIWHSLVHYPGASPGDVAEGIARELKDGSACDEFLTLVVWLGFALRATGSLDRLFSGALAFEDAEYTLRCLCARATDDRARFDRGLQTMIRLYRDGHASTLNRRSEATWPSRLALDLSSPARDGVTRVVFVYSESDRVDCRALVHALRTCGLPAYGADAALCRRARLPALPRPVRSVLLVEMLTTGVRLGATTVRSRAEAPAIPFTCCVSKVIDRWQTLRGTSLPGETAGDASG
jgi:hypothetical protein